MLWASYWCMVLFVRSRGPSFVREASVNLPELTELVRSGESERLEFKRTTGLCHRDYSIAG